MTLRKMKGNFDRFFDKTLNDLVRGIRNNKENEAKYIAECIEEIKEKLKQDNMSVKTNAIAKLTYLQMLGYDISWAAFNIVEVMSSTKFTYKENAVFAQSINAANHFQWRQYLLIDTDSTSKTIRIGYLSGSQCFHENTEVMMLTTNMIRKDLNSQNMYDAGCAMSGLACFISADLSRDLANDVMTLLTSTKPYLRKKAVLLMYKIFLKYPEALKPAFPRLKEKLDDPDPGVQSAAVNVICELARKNPKNYLSLAPTFFKLMTNSTNNWMLIKIIKLFGALIPLEPRLGRKIIEPLTNLIDSTSAMSLLYECINTVIAVLISISSGLPNHNASMQLCVQKLRILIEDSDQNLKYLGLLAMSKILKTHPKSVQAHKDLVLACLDDKDESIRLRALDLLYGMVSKKNLMEIVKKLMTNVSQSQLGNKYRDELVSKIVDICSQNDYQYIVNFEWYLSVLSDLTRIEGGTNHGSLIANQMLDVAIRVESIRKFATEQMAILIENSNFFVSSSVSEVLYASAWICGEFADFLVDKKKVVLHLITKQSFPPHIESIFIHNASKIFSKIYKQELERISEQENSTVCSDKPEDAAQSDGVELNGEGLNGELNGSTEFTFNSLEVHRNKLNPDFVAYCHTLLAKLEPFLISDDLEVQERSNNLSQMIKYCLEVEDDPELSVDFESILYAYPLNPVASIAQRKVPVPVGLELDQAFRITDDRDSGLDEASCMIFVKDENEEDDNDGNDSDDESESERDSMPTRGKLCKDKQSKKHGEKKKRKAEIQAKSQEYENNPNYLKSSKKKVKPRENLDEGVEQAEDAIVLNQEVIKPKNMIPGLVSSDSYMKKIKSRKSKTSKKRKSNGGADDDDNKVSGDGEEEQQEKRHVITIKGLEMPEGVDLNDLNGDDDEEDRQNDDDPHKVLSRLSLEEPTVIETKTNKSSIYLLQSDPKEKKAAKKSKKLTRDEDKEKRPKKSKKITDGGDCEEKPRKIRIKDNESRAKPPTSLDLDKKKKKKKSSNKESVTIVDERGGDDPHDDGKKKLKRKKVKKAEVQERSVFSGASDDLCKEEIKKERQRADYEETLEGVTTPNVVAETPMTPSVNPIETEILETLLPKSG